jgi:hypothetical protein
MEIIIVGEHAGSQCLGGVEVRAGRLFHCGIGVKANYKRPILSTLSSIEIGEPTDVKPLKSQFKYR